MLKTIECFLKVIVLNHKITLHYYSSAEMQINEKKIPLFDLLG